MSNKNCEKHWNVNTPGVCVICIHEEIEKLRKKLKEVKRISELVEDDGLVSMPSLWEYNVEEQQWDNEHGHFVDTWRDVLLYEIYKMIP